MTPWEPIVFLAAPLVAALWVLLASRRPNLREAGSFACALAMAAAGVAMALQANAGSPVEWMAWTLLPALDGPGGAALSVGLHLRADAAGSLFAVVASVLWVVTAVYSIGYMRGLKERAQTRYYFWFAMCLFGAGGLALAGNLLTFYLFFEVLTLSAWPLVVHKEDANAYAGGRKYLAYTLTGGVALLLAIAWTHSLAGTLDLRPGGILPADALTSIGHGRLWALFALFLIGVGVKSAIMPLHGWLPSAMVAPTPVSALLHAVAVVKAGVFGVLRVCGWVFGPEVLSEIGAGDLLLTAGAATILLGSLIALSADNLKRRLAFSTVSQLSYIVVGVALATPAAMIGAVMHIVNHAFMKITLFFCAGAIYVHAHKTNVSQLDGLGRRMPFTFGAFAIASLGLAGFPPIAGFTSKWYLMWGAVEAGHPLLLGVFIASALLNVAYLMPIVIRGFFGTPKAQASGHEGDHADLHDAIHGEASFALVGPLVFTAAIALALGIYPDLGVGFLSLAARAVAEVGL